MNKEKWLLLDVIKMGVVPRSEWVVKGKDDEEEEKEEVEEVEEGEEEEEEEEKRH